MGITIEGKMLCGVRFVVPNSDMLEEAAQKHFKSCAKCKELWKIKQEYQRHGHRFGEYFCRKCNRKHHLSKIGLKHFQYAEEK